MSRAPAGVRQVVLEREAVVPHEGALFAAGSRIKDMSLMVPATDYVALGEPERITVTIRNRDVGAPVNEQYVAGLGFAAEMVHAEARWQTERQMSGHADAGPIADRMTEVEKALRTVMRTTEPGDRQEQEEGQ